jgi:hypothetical protein
VHDPARLVVFHQSQPFPGWTTADNRESVLSYPLYRDFRERSRVFDGVIARSSAPVTIADGGTVESGRAELVSGNLFQVLGLTPTIGRLLQPADDGAPGGSPVVVVSAAYWQQRFGGSPSVLNRKITVNGHPMVVVGVAPRSFHGLIAGNAPELFVPIAMKRQVTPTWDGLEDRGVAWLTVVGRLRPGVSIDTARTQAIAGHNAPRQLRNLFAAIRSPFASVVLTSLDGKPLAQSRRMLLTAGARAANTGRLRSPTRTQVPESVRSPPFEGSARRARRMPAPSRRANCHLTWKRFPIRSS